MKTSISAYINMEPSMRTFLLLALAFVVINGYKVKNILLKECIQEVDEILDTNREKIRHLYVKDIFQKGHCSADTICQAGKVLSNTFLNKSLLHRNLFQYAQSVGHENCNVTASEDCKMADFLQKLQNCCQKLNSKNKNHVKLP